MLCERRAAHTHATAYRRHRGAWGVVHIAVLKSTSATRERRVIFNHESAADSGPDLLALALTWCYAILWSWSIYPFIFSVLSKTENRFLGFLAVLGAYGAWGFVNAIGCVVAMEAVRSGAWTPVFVWFGACIAWNACLFRSRPVPRRAKVA